MNEQIDWSKAPEGTEAAYAGCSQLYMAWYRRDASGRVEQICPGAGVHNWQDMGGRRDFPFGHTLKPAPAIDRIEQTSRQRATALIWSGEGLPPIGSVCVFQGEEAKCPSDPWHKDLCDGVKCTVIAHFKSKKLDLVAFTFVKPDGNTEVEQSLPGALAPVRTPEQIAAEARDKAINQMEFDTDCLDRGTFTKLYNAGWRKQVQS